MDFELKAFLVDFYLLDSSKNLDNPQGVSFDKPICLIFPCSINFFKIS